MPRFAFRIEYDGRPFSGWQRQNHVPSVQGAVEAALAKLEKDAPSIAAAGRTDAGVHALGQVAHCDLAQEWEPAANPAIAAAIACRSSSSVAMRRR